MSRKKEIIDSILMKEPIAIRTDTGWPMIVYRVGVVAYSQIEKNFYAPEKS
jgi:hypothetical protein